MPDSSTPNPSDPENQANGPDPSKAEASPPEEENKGDETAKKRPQIKLKRLVVKDMEIHPHVNPDAEPIPEAKPYEEPVEPPVDMSEHPEHKKLSLKEAPEMGEAPPSEEQPIPQEDQAEDKSAAGKSAKPPPSRSRRFLKVISPLLLVAGILYIVHMYFDPLGLKPPDPINPSGKLTALQETKPAPEASPEQEAPPPSYGLEPADMSIEEFLRLLGEQELNISTNPPGVFVNSVFFAVGSSLNPAIGLSVKSVSTEMPTSRLVIEDENGGTYTVSLN